MLKQLVLLSFFCTQLVGMSWCNLCFMSTLLRKAVLIFLYFSLSRVYFGQVRENAPLKDVILETSKRLLYV